MRPGAEGRSIVLRQHEGKTMIYNIYIHNLTYENSLESESTCA